MGVRRTRDGGTARTRGGGAFRDRPAGLVRPDATPAERAKHRDTYLTNLAWAAERVAPSGVDILIEPINDRDMPGYFLSTQVEAHAVVQEVGASHLKVQLDLCHRQIVEGDLTATLRRDLPTGPVGHLQIAGVPDRGEPDRGEINVRHLLDVADELGSWRVPDRRGPSCPRPAGGEWRSPPPVLQRLEQEAGERGGRLDGTVRAEHAKHRKGNGAHHKEKATGERT